MGRHSEKEPQVRRHRVQSSRLGADALGVVLERDAHQTITGKHRGQGAAKESAPRKASGGRHHAESDPAEVEAGFWRHLGDRIRSSSEKEIQVKDRFDSGVRRLVAQGQKYHPRILEALPSARMTPVVDDRREAQLGRARGMVDTFGRYLSLRTLDDDAVSFHELSHRVFRLGKAVYEKDERTGQMEHKGYAYSILNEPIAEELSQDTMDIMAGLDRPDDRIYKPHSEVLAKTLQIGRTSFRELTAIASGSDPEANYEILRSTIWERAGWDVVGYADAEYWHELNTSTSENAGYDAAERINDALTPCLPDPAVEYGQAA